jgi:hypothetical protein
LLHFRPWPCCSTPPCCYLLLFDKMVSSTLYHCMPQDITVCHGNHCMLLLSITVCHGTSLYATGITVCYYPPSLYATGHQCMPRDMPRDITVCHGRDGLFKGFPVRRTGASASIYIKRRSVCLSVCLRVCLSVCLSVLFYGLFGFTD